jgi:hypothetical protein
MVERNGIVEGLTCCQGKYLTSGKPRRPRRRRKSTEEGEAEGGKSRSKGRPSKNEPLEKKSSQDNAGDDQPKLTSEEAKARQMRRLAWNTKRAEERLKMMFETSVDPFEKPLRWWEQPHVKYA